MVGVNSISFELEQSSLKLLWQGQIHVYTLPVLKSISGSPATRFSKSTRLTTASQLCPSRANASPRHPLWVGPQEPPLAQGCHSSRPCHSPAGPSALHTPSPPPPRQRHTPTPPLPMKPGLAVAQVGSELLDVAGSLPVCLSSTSGHQPPPQPPFRCAGHRLPAAWRVPPPLPQFSIAAEVPVARPFQSQAQRPPHP